jgi:hypothetical protein
MEWRYGLAAHRVILIDVGHVCQNLYLASEALGAGTCAVAAYDQDLMDRLLVIYPDSYLVSLMTLPVTLSFHDPLCCMGQLKEIAPGRGQSLTQQPPYQHSSGCNIIGGSPFSGLGI